MMGQYGRLFMSTSDELPVRNRSFSLVALPT